VLTTVRDFIEAVREGKINREDVWCYFLGYWRFFCIRYAPFLVRAHIVEQLAERSKRADPDCKKLGECLGCGCAFPAVMYCNKACILGCYPKMLKKDEWYGILDSECSEFTSEGAGL